MLPGSETLISRGAGAVVVQQQQTTTVETVKQKRKKAKLAWDDYRSWFMTSLYEGLAAFCWAWVSLMTPTSATYGPGFTAFANGLSYAAMSHAFGGAAIFPFFSMARAISLQLHPGYMLCHWVAQFIGFILAAVTANLGTSPGLGPSVPFVALVPIWMAFIATFIGTYVVCWCVLAAGYEGWNPMRSWNVGMITTGVMIALGPYTTGVIDPYRMLVADIFGGFNAEAWIYAVGPFVATAACGLFTLMSHLDHLHMRCPEDGTLEVKKDR